MGGQLVQEYLLQIGLVEHRRLGVAGRAGRGVPTELGDPAVPAVEEPEARHGAADLGELRGDAGLLQDAQHLAVDVHGAGEGVGRGVAFQHEGGDAAAGEQEGGGEPDRPRADHNDPSRCPGRCGGFGHAVTLALRQPARSAACRHRCCGAVT